MNQVVLIGRLTKAPETRYTQDGMAIARFSLAVDRQTKGEKKADFINILVFGKSAENCEKYLDKGRKVAIEGRIQTGSYTKDDGTKVYTTDVVANRVEFIDWGEKKKEEEVPAGYEALDEDLPF
jgi:single-strand DNA-binding protein